MRLSLSKQGRAILVDALLIIAVLSCFVAFAYLLAHIVIADPLPLPRR